MKTLERSRSDSKSLFEGSVSDPCGPPTRSCCCASFLTLRCPCTTNSPLLCLSLFSSCCCCCCCWLLLTNICSTLKMSCPPLGSSLSCCSCCCCCCLLACSCCLPAAKSSASNFRRGVAVAAAGKGGRGGGEQEEAEAAAATTARPRMTAEPAAANPAAAAVAAAGTGKGCREVDPGSVRGDKPTAHAELAPDPLPSPLVAMVSPRPAAPCPIPPIPPDGVIALRAVPVLAPTCQVWLRDRGLAPAPQLGAAEVPVPAVGAMVVAGTEADALPAAAAAAAAAPTGLWCRRARMAGERGGWAAERGELTPRL